MTPVTLGTVSNGFYWMVILDSRDLHTPIYSSSNGHKWKLDLTFANGNADELHVKVTCHLDDKTTPFDTLYNAKCEYRTYSSEDKLLGSWTLAMNVLKQEMYHVAVRGKTVKPKPVVFRRIVNHQSSLEIYKCKVLVNWCNEDYMLYVQKPKSSGVTKKLLDGLPSLCLQKRFSDIVLKIGECEMNAHKYVLSATSDVFDTMFSQDMMEQSSGCVQISDLTEQGVKGMLTFMYCREVSFASNQEALDVFSAAQKYNVTDLKVVCREFLFSHLDNQTSMDVLVFSHIHDEKLLRCSASSCVCREPLPTSSNM